MATHLPGSHMQQRGYGCNRRPLQRSLQQIQAHDSGEQEPEGQTGKPSGVRQEG